MTMKKHKKGFTLIELMTVIAILALLVAIMFPHFWQAYARGRVTACASNLKNIATAIQVYSAEYGQFPKNLGVLTPEYLKIMPICPEAGCDTYTTSYELNDDATSYVICCKGSNHTPLGYKADEPYYRFERGLGP